MPLSCELTTKKVEIQSKPIPECPAERRRYLSWSIFVLAMDSFFSVFLFFFFFNDGTTGNGEENCLSLHVSKNRDNFQVSWTWTHSVKFPAIKKVISDCAISKKRKKGSSRWVYSCFFTHNGITTPNTTREGQESTTKTSLHFAWPRRSRTKCFSLRELKTGSSILDYFYAVAGRNLEACMAA